LDLTALYASYTSRFSILNGLFVVSVEVILFPVEKIRATIETETPGTSEAATISRFSARCLRSKEDGRRTDFRLLSRLDLQAVGAGQ
jgi:hypothetical protein